jgi:DNA polymerase I-like protein with 3'-5' exonuclease and polymerase domains
VGKKAAFSIDQDVLNALRDEGVVSEILELRLRYADSAHMLNQYIEKMLDRKRVYPNMTTPQASGRMSVSAPPLVNFTADKKYGPKGIRDVIVPDLGTKWECGDWEAIEARIISHASRDEGDTEAFTLGWDIHTYTAVGMFKWPKPPGWTKAEIFASPAGQEWCAEIGRTIHRMECRLTQHAGCPIHSYSDDHRFRRLAKNCRYCLQYARDEKAMSRYAVEMKMPKEQLWTFGKLYLASKQMLVAWKRSTWANCLRTHEARTLYWGRRRRLDGDRNHIEKEGLNHIIQGAVADMLKETLLLFMASSPRPLRLAYQSHDGWKIVYPREAEVRSIISPIAEREITMDGRPIRFPASWETTYAPGEEAVERSK